jgi:hypothetical protein
MRKKVLLIGGSINQTTMVHAVATELQKDHDCYFSPYYCDAGLLGFLQRHGRLDFTIMGGQFLAATQRYLADHGLPVDYGGRARDYDLVVTTTDLVIQRNIRDKPIVLIQEGMTDPENLMYYLAKWLGFPRYLASTATTGLSDAYQVFCVTSEGYREHFIRKGVRPDKIAVTGIPNFDHAASFYRSSFPYHDYVLVATSDTRETFKFDSRRRFIRRALEIAAGRPIIFKLHPNENHLRAVREIRKLAPRVLVLTEGDIGPMIANCHTLITQYSSVAFIGLALDKIVHSYFDVDQLRQLLPIQNGGTSHKHIAAVCHNLLEGQPAPQMSPASKPRLLGSEAW